MMTGTFESRPHFRIICTTKHNNIDLYIAYGHCAIKRILIFRKIPGNLSETREIITLLVRVKNFQLYSGIILILNETVCDIYAATEIEQN
jgi:hypothetical protein